jgi:hypothetical protein
MGKMCHCDYCEGRREQRYELEGSGDGWEETPYRKASRSNWNRKGDRPCKKSKDKEPCDFSTRKVKGSKRLTDGTGYTPRFILSCSRCGKEQWAWFSPW